MRFPLLTVIATLALFISISSWQIQRAVEATDPIVSIFYCGFSGQFCGQSTTDDINPTAKFVILAFANTQSDGKVIVDDDHFPTALVTNWRKNGKKVFISVGGENGNWAYVFASSTSIANFIASLTATVNKHKLDGVDLDIESYLAPPRVVANTIIQLKESLSTLGKKYIIVSPECVTVYQGVGVPDPDSPGQPFNYFVPIINLADSAIDYYQPQAYNNWYDGIQGGTPKFFQDVYLNWRNLQGLSPWAGPLKNFTGVAAKKLLIGVLASQSAGGAAYYGPPANIKEFRNWLTASNYTVAGFMMWDSHWDTLNNNLISNACA